ncbi:TonB-dependent receptor [Rosettibacter firmus]|uniref:TonB-dependent receptor n=1 Tax=Rosettibacter firmus TaxID=3111522 RepID=UPI00336C15CA
MREKKYRIILMMFICVVVYVGISIAGTTGKIAGRIVDKQTKEPLIGVNVVVKGTTLGATTDVDGYYVILHVPPGLQTIVASMVGYATVTVNDVEVRIDQTSTVNIEMVPEAIELGSIVITAEREIVKKDVSTSVATVRSEEITTLPITRIDRIASLQAGVEEGFVIRGGSATQLLFQVDGVTLRDPRNNSPITTLALSSIQEISIERGGFNAEYGQVRSGIVNIIQKEGSINNYYGAVNVKYSPPTPKHFGISVFDPNSMWNRPYLDPAVAWTGTENGAWDIYTQRQYPRFEGWNAISQKLLSDNDPNNDLSPAAAQKVWMWERRRRPTIEPDYIIDASFGGPIPVISKSLGNLRFFTSFWYNREALLIPLSRPDYLEYNYSLKLNSDISNKLKLVISANTGKSFNVAMNRDDSQFNNPAWGINGVQFWSPTAFMRTPYTIAEITNEQRPSRIFTDSWYSQAILNHATFAGKLTNFLSDKSLLEVSFEHVLRAYKTGPIRQRDTTKKYEIVPGYFVDEAPFGFDPRPLTGLTGMFFGGHSSTIRDTSRLSSTLIKANYTNQITHIHLIKAGVEFAYYDLNLNYGAVNTYFNDLNYVKERWNPYRISAYIQDKIEAFGFVANVGVRMDLSNPNTDWYDVDPFDKTFFSSSYNPNKEYPKKRAKIDLAFSPRLGISHPITENSKLYFNFGHFKQLPAYEEIFRLGRASNGTLLNYGDPNLQQAKTISYELGYDHLLFNTFLIQISAFYNDISNQLSFTQYLSDRKGIGYFRANNNSYEDIRGLEITLKKTGGNWIRGFLTYTYQVNTRGAFGKQVINEDPSQQKLIDQNTITLYQQKPVPQPRANLNLTFFTPSQYGPSFGGLYPFGNWTLNILGEWRAGEYITYNPNGIREIINNVQVTDYWNVDLLLSKTVDLKPFQITFLIDVRNLFNFKRLSGAGFYDNFDQLFYLQSLHLPPSPAYDNIPGNDRVGDYRKEGVPYQPIEQVVNVYEVSNPNPIVIYYDKTTKKYMNYVNNEWSEVDNAKMQKILEDKAYIDMPNNTSFNFLNPRQVFFGINISFNL